MHVMLALSIALTVFCLQCVNANEHLNCMKFKPDIAPLHSILELNSNLMFKNFSLIKYVVFMYSNEF